MAAFVRNLSNHIPLITESEWPLENSGNAAIRFCVEISVFFLPPPQNTEKVLSAIHVGRKAAGAKREQNLL